MPIPRLLRVLAFAAAVTASLPSRAVAQPGQIGVLFGATYPTLRGLDRIGDALESRTGLIGGGYLLMPMPGPLQLQVEGLLVNKGAQSRVGTADDGIELSYLEVPVLLRLNFAPRSPLNPHAYAGPYFGLRLSCTVGRDEVGCDEVPGISTKTVDVGGVAGGGLALDVGGLVLTGGARYAFGVSTLAEFEGNGVREAAKHGGWAIYAGLGVRLGRR